MPDTESQKFLKATNLDLSFSQKPPQNRVADDPKPNTDLH